MSVNAYVLVETHVGKAKSIAEKLVEMSRNGHSGQILDVSTVTGQYDVIVTVTMPDLDSLGSMITKAIQTIPGVESTTTCISMGLR